MHTSNIISHACPEEGKVWGKGAGSGGGRGRARSEGMAKCRGAGRGAGRGACRGTNKGRGRGREGSRASHKLTVLVVPPDYPHRWPCGGPGGEHCARGDPITVRHTFRLTSQLHINICQKLHCLPCCSALTETSCKMSNPACEEHLSSISYQCQKQDLVEQSAGRVSCQPVVCSANPIICKLHCQPMLTGAG